MSRSIDAYLIANLVMEAVRCVASNEITEAVARQMKRFTFGLTEYERDEVANVVRFRLATAAHA